MNIQAIATQTGLTTDTIRYYEKLKLLTPTRDPNNNYRIYSAADVKTLELIKSAKLLGFTLTETQALAELLSANDLTRKEMASKLSEKRADISHKITQLQAIQAQIDDALKGNCEHKNLLGR